MPDLAFRVTEPGSPPREVAISAGLTIGRVDDNTCVIADDAKISGHHAHVIENDEGSLVIEDLGSSNHTHILNGPVLQKGEQHALALGTAVQMGETKLVVVVAGQDASPSAVANKTVAAHIAYGAGDEASETVGPDNDPTMAGLAELAAFKTAKPRLVICNEAIKDIVEVDNVSFLIGRSEGAVNYMIDHQAVSGNHAMIRFTNRKFYIEDQGSRNGTYVNGEMLAPNSRIELPPESHVRFGSVDALFAVACDSEGRKMNHQRYRSAVNLLEAEGKITKLQREKAEGESRGSDNHAGEFLLKNGFIKVEQWVDAMKRGEIYAITQAGRASGGGGSRALVLIVLLLLAVIVLLLVKPELKEWIGFKD